MPDFAEPLARLITEFKRLPGIGQKSAQRIAFHMLRASRDDAEQLAQAVLDVKDKLVLCAVCNNISDASYASIAAIRNRDHKVVCVVEDPHNIVGIESHAPVQRTLSRAARRALSAARHRAGATEDQGLVDRIGKAKSRSDRGDQPHGGRRSDRGLSCRNCSSRWESRSRASPWESRWAAISNSPTK
jgi:recombination protein RecR